MEPRLALAPLAELPQLLADINAGDLSAAPGSSVVIGNVAYFAANDSTNGVELWKTDGTAAGTKLVKDIQPGPGSSNPQSLAVFGGKLYFRANDGTHGDEIWQSDGTPAGTKLLTDLAPGSQSSYPGNFATANNKLYFTATDNDPGQNTFFGPSPYLSAADSPFDRSQLGTDFWIEDFEDGQLNTRGVSVDYGSVRSPSDLTDSVDADDGQIDNNGLTGHSYLVRPGMTGVTFTFNRTTLGGLPTNVGIVLTGGGDDGPGLNVEFFDAGGNLIGTTNDMFPKPISGVTSDDRFVGLTHAGGICAIRISGVLAPSNTGIELDHLQYGAVVSAVGSMQLWLTDGSGLGTSRITDLRNQPRFSAADLNGTLYFTGSTPTAGIELWKLDANSAVPPVQVMDINPGTANSNPRALTVVDGTLYFVAGDGVHGNELWKLDANGPSLVKDINPGLAHAGITSLSVLAGKLLFSASDGTSGEELWQSDGTESGTVLVKDIKPGSDGSSPAQFVNGNGTMFFTADDGEHFVELWKTDGTPAGTAMVKDIAPGSRSSRLQALTAINDTLYFAANDDQAGLELWQSDGTTAGTTLVADLNAGANSAPRNIVEINNHLVFTANDGLHGWEPFSAPLVPGDITTGLAHRWTFDETAGTTAHDIVGGSDGTLLNWNATEAKWIPGRVGGALQFSSADDAVIATPPALTGSYAVSFWLNVIDRYGTNPRIFGSRVGNEIVVNNDSFRGVAYYGPGSREAAADPSQPTYNTWDHYVLNFNVVTGQGIVYRNGTPVAIGSYSESASLATWVFGHSSDLGNTTDSLHGALDDLRVYNRLLTDDDVALLASQGTPAPTHVGPVHHWTFDAVSGFTAHDTVGGANGTLIGWNQTEPRWVPGVVDGALAFTTANNAVVTPPISTQAQWSVAFWLNVAASDGINPRIIEPWAYINFDNNQGMGFSYGSANTFDPARVQLNKWDQYTITFDTIADKGTIYRNGIAVNSGFYGGNSPAFALVFGHNQDLSNPGDSLNGLLDDLRIYDRVLSPAEIQRLTALTPVEVKPDSYSLREDTLLTVVAAQGVLANDTDLDDSSPQAFLDVGPQHGTLVLQLDGSFTYQPALNYNGPDQFTYRLQDRLGNDVVGTVALTVTPFNNSPSFTVGPNISASDEQGRFSPTTTIGFDDLTGAPDNLFYNYNEGDFLVYPTVGRWIEAHDPSHITGHPAPALYSDSYNGTLEIKRASGGTFALAGFDLASWEFDFFATDSPVQYTVEGLLNGQTLYTSTGQVATSDFHAIDALPGNFIDTLRFHMVRVDSQAYILDNIRLVIPGSIPSTDWATGLSPGSPDEASQQLNFVVTTDQPQLFEIQPALDPSGKLTYLPRPNVSGTATVSVALYDDGGDTSPTQTFTINIVKEHPWHNVGQRTDVDGDGEATPSDVLAIINYINAGLPDTVPGSSQTGLPNGFLDVDANNSISAADALAVINAINAAPAKPAATFVSLDTSTQGNWIGKYGSEGYSLNSGPVSLPPGVQVSFKSGLTEIYDYVVEDANADPQALQIPGSDDRLLATWTGDYGFMLDFNFSDTRTHRLALYVPGPRYQRMDIIDANTGALLDTRVAEAMDSGQYLVWNVAGHVKIRFSNLANGLNAVLSGIFFG